MAAPCRTRRDASSISSVLVSSLALINPICQRGGGSTSRMCGRPRQGVSGFRTVAATDLDDRKATVGRIALKGFFPWRAAFLARQKPFPVAFFARRMIGPGGYCIRIMVARFVKPRLL
jgi:hypothetical protein